MESFGTGDADVGYTPDGSISVTRRSLYIRVEGEGARMEKSARPRTALNECVKVVVRCRPLSARERSEGHDEVSLVYCCRGCARSSAPKSFAKNPRAVIVFKYHGTRSSCLFIIIDSRQPLARRLRCSLVLSMSFIRATKYASAAVKQLLIRSGAACGPARKSTAAGAVHLTILIAQHNGPLK